MRPGRPNLPPRDTSGGGVGTIQAERRGSRWARGVRPLRRREGIPAPLETPDFLHRSELQTVRARNRALAITLLTLVGVASVVAIGLRAFLG